MIAPKPKQETERALAKGGSGRNKTMFSKQSAGPAKPAITGKAQTAAPGRQRAVGGARMSGASLSKPAAPGHTAPVRKGRLPKEK